MRPWRNGRRARLRGVWATVLVRVQSAAPFNENLLTAMGSTEPMAVAYLNRF